MIRILGACSPGEVRIAVCDGDMLQDYALWRPGAPDGLGDIYAGRIIAQVPAMAGAFVALPDAEGFLPDTECAGLADGALIRVRVIRAAQGGKGPRLARAGDGTLPPGKPPGLLERGPSPLHRLAAAYQAAPIHLDDAGLLAGLRASLPGRLHKVPCAFTEAVETEIDGLSAAWCDLPGGMRAGFFPIPALTAIDLDGAGTTAWRGEKPKMQFAANRAALPALARQIRLRNLSGGIVVDLAGLPAKRRAALGPDFLAALAADPAKPRLLGFTQLGFAEILRPRTAPPLHELLAGPHAAGLAALRHLSRQLNTAPHLRPSLRASPDVVAALQADTAALADFARLNAHELALESDPALPSATCLTEMV